MSRALRTLLGALGVAIVALIAALTPHVSGFTRAVLGLLSAVRELFSPQVPSTTRPCTPASTIADCTAPVAARSTLRSASN